MTEDRLLTTKETMEIASIGRTTLWKRVKEGAFPQPVPVSSNSNRWLHSEVMAWIEGLRKLRDSEDKDEAEAA